MVRLNIDKYSGLVQVRFLLCRQFCGEIGKSEAAPHLRDTLKGFAS